VSLLLLDTTFLIDAERSARETGGVIADEDEVAIAAVTVAELLVGVHLASGRRRAARRGFVDEVLQAVPVIPYDLAVAAEHADLLAWAKAVGRPRGAHDLIIAATARSTRREVVTADLNAFAGLPGVVIRDQRRHR
jgi:tRNA(fMet)-specific endonuclease VapC